jgi:chaperonin GroEL
MQEGILPGGGVALRACQAAVSLNADEDPDARAAERILRIALEAPMRAILRNAGWDDSTVMARLQSPQQGFDVLRGELSDMEAAGIYDSAAVVKMALRTAISGAALALTTDLIIHQKQAPQGVNP